MILFGRDPGLDQPAAFLRQLSGLVKHALNRGGGRARISELAAALAAREATVRQGLGWLAGRGHIAIAGQEEDLVSLTPDDGLARPESADAAARLEALLAETAAYRAYFVTADKDRLIRAFADSPIC